MAFLTVDDLTPFASIDSAKAAVMIEDAEAMAVLVAPCLASLPDDSPYRAAVKAILRGAILRWDEAGTGAATTQTAGIYSQTLDTRQVRRAMFQPTEITDLQAICKSVDPGSVDDRKAFGVNLAVSQYGTDDLAMRPDLWFQWRWPA